ncbi:MAG: hypothetical protein ACOYEP_06500 [Limnochordia bacterium]|jgi:chromosome segregation ATPase
MATGRTSNELLEEFKSLVKQVGKEVSQEAVEPYMSRVSNEWSRRAASLQKDLSQWVAHLDELERLQAKIAEWTTSIDAFWRQQMKLMEQNDIPDKLNDLNTHMALLRKTADDLQSFSDTAGQTVQHLGETFSSWLQEISDRLPSLLEEQKRLRSGLYAWHGLYHDLQQAGRVIQEASSDIQKLAVAIEENHRKLDHGLSGLAKIVSETRQESLAVQQAATRSYEELSNRLSSYGRSIQTMSSEMTDSLVSRSQVLIEAIEEQGHTLVEIQSGLYADHDGVRAKVDAAVAQLAASNERIDRLESRISALMKITVTTSLLAAVSLVLTVIR